MMAAVNEAIHVTSQADGGDPRLTNDPIVVPPHLPLEEITVSTTSPGDNDGDDDDDLSSISMEDEIDALAEATATNTPSRPRSIFSHRDKIACADVVDRPSSPACVMMNMSSSSLPVVRRSSSRSRNNKYSSKTYQYSYEGGANPYEHFGIAQDYYGDEEEQQQKKEQQPLQESDSSLNTYERMISGAESSNRNTNKNKSNNKSSNVFNVWMSFFANNSNGTAGTATATTRHSAPSLRDLDRQSNKNTRNVQSDPDLIKSPSKSCLRRGRFSSSVGAVKSPPVEDEAHEDGDDHESSSGHSDRTVVQFETNVQVFEFQRPVESWAENGWSSWFG